MGATNAHETAPRLVELDGLRGLAALSVLCSHLWLFTRHEGPATPARAALWALCDGEPAVLLFFTLSGFVLARPYLGDPARPLAPAGFLLRRALRIAPPCYAALLLCVALRAFAFRPGGLAHFSPWAQSFWSSPVTAEQLARHALLLAPGIQTRLLDPVLWSLLVELKLSLVFPLLLWALRGATTPARSALLVSAVALLALGGAARGVWPLQVLPLFAAGAWLSRAHHALARRWDALPRLARVPGWMLALALFRAAHLWPWLARHELARLLTVGAGSLALLALVLSEPRAKALLRKPAAQALGAVSYSFYLVHLPLLLAVSSRAEPWSASPALCFALASAASLLTAWALARCVEGPSQALGRDLAARLGER